MSSTPRTNPVLAGVGAPLPESRIFRLAVYAGQTEKELAHAARTAADAGFGAILAPCALGGLPLFPCRAANGHRLPSIAPEFRKRDVLAEAAAAAEEAGLGLYCSTQVWEAPPEPSARAARGRLASKKDWFALGPKALTSRFARPFRDRLVFCPSNAERRRYLGDLISEAIEGYPIKGLILDTLSPPASLEPGSERCFCPLCVERAKEDLGLDLRLVAAKTPSAEALQSWEEWQDEIARWSLEYLCLRSRTVRPQMPIRCVVEAAGETGGDEDSGILADVVARRNSRMWRKYLTEGIIDGLDLTGLPAEEQFAEAIERNLAVWPDDALIYPNLDVSEPEELAPRLNVLRRQPILGFVVEWGGPLPAVAAEQMAATLMAPDAEAMDENPLEGLKKLCAEIGRIAPADLGVTDFLCDLMGFVDRAEQRTIFEALEVAVDNLRGLEARILGGEIDFGEYTRLALCRLGQAKRLARLASFRVGA